MGEVWLENHVEILKHLDLLDLKSEPLPRANGPMLPLTTLNLTWTIPTGA